MRVSIGIVQMEIADGDVKKNLSKGMNYVLKLLRTGVDIVVLPELWTTGFGVDAIRKYAESPGKGISITPLKSLTYSYDSIVISTVPLRIDNRIYNASLIIYKGDIIAIYRKIHLFRFYKEDKVFSSGDEVVVVNTKFGKLGLTICYDLRFPELYRVLTSLGAEVIAVPASWGASRVNQWSLLLRARAIENQVFVVGANRVGGSSLIKEGFGGYSAIINPYGYDVLSLGNSECVTFATIDLDMIKEVRTKLPVWYDRRKDLYVIKTKWGIGV